MGKSSRAANVRHGQIVGHLNGKGEVTAQELAEKFSVSLASIRRDLQQLEQVGSITRTHGGAILSKPGIVEFAFQERGNTNAPEKRAIARAVAAMIEPGSSVALDSGTTTLEVAKAIAGIPGLTVLTSSLAIASVLYAHDELETVLLGGTARRGSPDLTGWLTAENLTRFHVDYAIVGADGVTPDGVFTIALDLASVCEGVMQAGTQRILVVDHSKIGRRSFCRYAAVKQFDRIITDTGVRASERKWLKKLANDVLYVKA
ncbi:MAG: DeoR/GlpR family DNA-binding transcription regulator [Candidatus Hydrogenedentes bacterium]|nr:DeoR/GlpR family DNA-binding transcription regulator [Candidatus Hydrogenedentota bacterium]